MIGDLSLTNVANGASGLLFVALGLLVARVRGGNKANAAFALFAIAFGVSMAVLNFFSRGIADPDPPDLQGKLLVVGISFLWVAAAGALVRLVLLLSPEGERRDRRALAVVASFVVAHVVVYLIGWRSIVGFGSVFGFLAAVSWIGLLDTMWAGAVLFALWYRRPAGGREKGYATMAAALALSPMFFNGFLSSLLTAGRAVDAQTWATPVFLHAAGLAVAAVWLVAAARSGTERSRTARNVAWIVLAASLAGTAAGTQATFTSDHWGPSVARVVGVFLLAFAIVRGQLPGVDAKLRFGVSRSTIAATFIAVFFLASEGAQILFGQDNEVIGLGAAGALVFAMAPLQRAADRLAERAIPVVEDAPPPAPVAASREEVYRAAVRRCLRDRTLSREEHRELAHLAGELGLHAGRAMEIVHEVEAEVGA